LEYHGSKSSTRATADLNTQNSKSATIFTSRSEIDFTLILPPELDEESEHDETFGFGGGFGGDGQADNSGGPIAGPSNAAWHLSGGSFGSV
jgi:hypothetical protein